MFTFAFNDDSIISRVNDSWLRDNSIANADMYSKIGVDAWYELEEAEWAEALAPTVRYANGLLQSMNLEGKFLFNCYKEQIVLKIASPPKKATLVMGFNVKPE